MPLSEYTVIYGGSFNPPHIGHQIACMWMCEALNAKEVIIIPTYKHAFGKELLDFEHRVEMCERMVSGLWPENESGPDRVWVSRIEEDLPHPNITLNTVKAIKGIKRAHDDNRDKVAVAIGSDLLHGLDEWTGWDEVLALAKVVVVGRTGAGHADHDYELYQYPVELSAISSSQIRGQVRREKDITGLVPTSVKQYIERKGLYR